MASHMAACKNNDFRAASEATCPSACKVAAMRLFDTCQYRQLRAAHRRAFGPLVELCMGSATGRGKGMQATNFQGNGLQDVQVMQSMGTACSLTCDNKGQLDDASCSCSCNPGYFGEKCQWCAAHDMTRHDTRIYHASRSYPLTCGYTHSCMPVCARQAR